jgi:hypothetical protein
MKKLALALIVGGLALAGSPGPATAETAPNQTFTVVKIGANPGTVVATGVINGVGVENNNRLQVLRGSQFQVVNSYAEGDLFETATPVSAESHFDPATCVTRTAIFNTFVITGGTGDLAGVTGSGEGTANLTTIGPRGSDGACLGPDAPPVFLISVVRLTATIDLG